MNCAGGASSNLEPQPDRPGPLAAPGERGPGPLVAPLQPAKTDRRRLEDLPPSCPGGGGLPCRGSNLAWDPGSRAWAERQRLPGPRPRIPGLLAAPAPAGTAWWTIFLALVDCQLRSGFSPKRRLDPLLRPGKPSAWVRARASCAWAKKRSSDSARPTHWVATAGGTAGRPRPGLPGARHTPTRALELWSCASAWGRGRIRAEIAWRRGLGGCEGQGLQLARSITFSSAASCCWRKAWAGPQVFEANRAGPRCGQPTLQWSWPRYRSLRAGARPPPAWRRNVEVGVGCSPQPPAVAWPARLAFDSKAEACGEIGRGFSPRRTLELARDLEIGRRHLDPQGRWSGWRVKRRPTMVNSTRGPGSKNWAPVPGRFLSHRRSSCGRASIHR